MMKTEQMIGSCIAAVLALGLMAEEPKVRFGGGIKANKQLKVSAATLAKAERRSENLLKTKFQRDMETFRLADVKCEDQRMDDFLKTLRKQVDDNGGPRVNLMLRATPKQRAVRITMDLQDIPVFDVLRYAAASAGLDCRLDEHAAIIEPKVPNKKK